ncbi:transcription factor Tfb4 [Ceraceosorus guamensis]|uniref:General transcription and DNA repair factor IIH subunit TFB4 n=1 Tax=Ceraceosorus guamensis TaxID=1522189 RepID=A0A316VSJ3_9BASI|nr:transcription factor Tfb4 [Ceraceosorus guamensis]PWN40018.1 transcription factor Tfb4 [Ceraceosorus guamensis]
MSHIKDVATSGVSSSSSSSSASANAGAVSASASTTTDFLALVVDVSPLSWTRLSGGGEGLRLMARALDEIIIFLNAHVGLQHGNGVVIYAAGNGDARLIYSTLEAAATTTTTTAVTSDANTYSRFAQLEESVRAGVASFLRDLTIEQAREDVAIVTAVARALCYLNRLDPTAASAAAGINPEAGRTPSHSQQQGKRILIISASEDQSGQYVPMMNCIFGAQKRGVVIDVCRLGGAGEASREEEEEGESDGAAAAAAAPASSAFLQQSTYLTRGNYIALHHPAHLLQTLLSAFLPASSIRPHLVIPNSSTIDFRASCFCHRRIVEVGYVCSRCLSIFCSPRKSCVTCGAAFGKEVERFKKEARAMGVVLVEGGEEEEEGDDAMRGHTRGV